MAIFFIDNLANRQRVKTQIVVREEVYESFGDEVLVYIVLYFYSFDWYFLMQTLNYFISILNFVY